MLAKMIVDKYENDKKNDWLQQSKQNRSIRITDKIYDKFGRKNINQEAKLLESKELIKIEWLEFGHDISKIKYSLKDIDKFYQYLNRVKKFDLYSTFLSDVNDIYVKIHLEWIKKYLEDFIQKLNKGYFDIEKIEEFKNIIKCLAAIDTLNDLIYKRVFSKMVFGNSKIFERKYESKVINIAKKYIENVTSEMTNKEILNEINIEEYAQELNIKGNICISIEDEIIDLSKFKYGVILNSDMLKNSQIKSIDNIKKVISIENKANFMAECYDKNTLIIFSHGFYSPLERKFLKKILDLDIDNRIMFYHSGDMDYGGILIFNYIKNNIFPKLKPLNMNVEIFKKYLNYSEEIDSQKIEKIKKIYSEELKDVIEFIIENKRVLEQEVLLFKE